MSKRRPERINNMLSLSLGFAFQSLGSGEDGHTETKFWSSRASRQVVKGRESGHSVGRTLCCMGVATWDPSNVVTQTCAIPESSGPLMQVVEVRQARFSWLRESTSDASHTLTETISGACRPRKQGVKG